jgi:hypothetical protein
MMPSQKSRSTRAALIGFAIGAVVPLFWGILGMLLFNIPEGWFSRAFWKAVYVTCPFWFIDGDKALVLMPLLNGFMYAVVALLVMRLMRISARRTPER